jgi:hypothetical protein
MGWRVGSAAQPQIRPDLGFLDCSNRAPQIRRVASRTSRQAWGSLESVWTWKAETRQCVCQSSGMEVVMDNQGLQDSVAEIADALITTQGNLVAVFRTLWW